MILKLLPFSLLFISSLALATDALITGFKPISDNLNSKIHLDREWIDSSPIGRTLYGNELSFFIRDMLIQRIDRKILIPAFNPEIHLASFYNKMRGSLPIEQQQAAEERKPGTRKYISVHGAFGLEWESQQFAVQLTESLGLELYKSSSVLEGGNVFILPRLDRAIVGFNSVALTLIALERGWRSYSHEIRPAPKEEVTEHAYLLARNQAYLDGHPPTPP